ASERVTQRVHPVDRHRKRELLSYLIGRGQWHQVLVFTRTKHGANRLTEQLIEDGISAAAIHGNKSQGARTKALEDFKRNTIRVLVATDIAARGIDIDQLPHVVNYELPNVPEDYVHRIGRTGRAEREGEAISLVCVDEHKFLRDIEKLIKRDIDQVVIPGFEPDPTIKAEPIKLGRNMTIGRNNGGGNNGGRNRNNNRNGNNGAKSSQAPRKPSAANNQPKRTANPGSSSAPKKPGAGTPKRAHSEHRGKAPAYAKR